MKPKKHKQIHAALLTGTIIAVVSSAIGSVFSVTIALDLAKQISGADLRNENLDAMYSLLKMVGFFSAILGPAYLLVQFKQGLRNVAGKIAGGISFITGFALFMIGFQQIRMSGTRDALKAGLDEIAAGGEVSAAVLEPTIATVMILAASFASVPCFLVVLLSMRFLGERWGGGAGPVAGRSK